MSIELIYLKLLSINDSFQLLSLAKYVINLISMPSPQTWYVSLIISCNFVINVQSLRNFSTQRIRTLREMHVRNHSILYLPL